MSAEQKPASQDLSHPQTFRQHLRLYLTGFAMGSADIVPGVSGGTMAFVLGIYETLINAIKSVDINVIRMVLKLDVKGVINHIPFRSLIAVLAGIGTAVLLLANLLHDLLTDEPTFIFAFFAGLIVASILAIGLKVKWSPGTIVAFLIAGILAFFIVGFDAEEHDPVADLIHAAEDGTATAALEADLIVQLEAAEFDNAQTQVAALIAAVQADAEFGELRETLDDALFAAYEPSDPLTVFFSGMLAICAMILPGISGSFILLIIGQYEVVLGAVKNFDIVSIMALNAGAGIGIILFSRVLSWLLKNYENVTVAALVGFMTGSLRLIWIRAVDGVDVVSDSGSLSAGQIAAVIGLAVAGFILVSFLDHLQSRTNPVFVRFWRPAPPVDTISEKAAALE